MENYSIKIDQKLIQNMTRRTDYVMTKTQPNKTYITPQNCTKRRDFWNQEKKRTYPDD